MNSLYVQDNFHTDLNEFPVRTRRCHVRTGNSFRSGLVVLYVEGIHLDPGESCLVRTGNSFRSV
jgi:hypothetical protein